MNGGMIWWNQIGNSLDFVSRVAAVLEEQCSAVLRMPEHVPWPQMMYEAVDYSRSTFGCDRPLKRLCWTPGGDPGAFLMEVEDLCPDQVRRNYWPGKTRAAYLGAREGIFLHHHFVWVTGIREPADLDRWLEFLDGYEEAARGRSVRAVFLLEYSGPGGHISGIRSLEYRVEHYDCRVFAMEAASALANARPKEYQAELASCMSFGAPELCWALLEAGEELLADPVTTALSVREKLWASGRTPAPLDRQKAHSAAWEAAAVLLFPKLEQWRIRFIAEHEYLLSCKLPIRNSNGEKVTDPRDLEIGSLWFIVNSSGARFSAEENEQIRLCRDVRNQLAHNKLLSRKMVQAVLDM